MGRNTKTNASSQYTRPPLEICDEEGYITPGKTEISNGNGNGRNKIQLQTRGQKIDTKIEQHDSQKQVENQNVSKEDDMYEGSWILKDGPQSVYIKSISIVGSSVYFGFDVGPEKATVIVEPYKSNVALAKNCKKRIERPIESDFGQEWRKEAIKTLEKHGSMFIGH